MSDTLKHMFKDRAFVICAAVLLATGLGMTLAQNMMKMYFRKLPVPLRKSLDTFDTGKMWPYKLAIKGSRLPSEIEDELGTRDYSHYIFEDTTLTQQNDPGKYVDLFVTYYTGSLDQVPHVPEECWTGAGKKPLDRGQIGSLTIPGIGLTNNELKVNHLRFLDRSEWTEQSVIYFFSVNGSFTAGRDETRMQLSNPLIKYGYFSKVELSFRGVQPNTEQARQAAAKFLAKALPILIDDHWPNWQEVINRKE